MATKAAAKPTSVDCQPKRAMARVKTGVITARPAIEPVDRKNSAMPRLRVNQRLSTGVSATGLTKPSPIDSSTPKDSRNSSGSRAVTVQTELSATMAVPESRTTRVPKRLIRCPATGIARP